MLLFLNLGNILCFMPSSDYGDETASTWAPGHAWLLYKILALYTAVKSRRM
jgi:hypothetical protein